MTPVRKELYSLGRKRKRDYVRVLRETFDNRPMIRVQWRELVDGQPRIKTESFEDTRNGLREAKAFAEGTHERLKSPAPTAAIAFPPITYRALWEAYVTAKLDAWRQETTLKNKQSRWKKVELFVGHEKDARQLTREKLDEFKRAMMANEHSVYQVQQHIKLVTALYRWAVDRDLVPPNKVTSYVPEFSRDAKRQVAEMTEYRAEERDSIIAALDPRSGTQWRAWALSVLFAYCGPRQRAARHLEWRDIDLETGRIHWRPETDKMGKERWQPMPAPVAQAFWVAYGWRCFDEYQGAYVFFGAQRRTRGEPLRRRDTHHAKTRTTLDGVTVKEKPYTYAAFHAQHAAAETRAHVEHKAYRSSHGHRRGVATDVHAATGSTRAAADWIGDASTKIVDRHYIKSREDEMRKYAGVVSDAMTKKPEDGK